MAQRRPTRSPASRPAAKKGSARPAKAPARKSAAGPAKRPVPAVKARAASKPVRAAAEKGAGPVAKKAAPRAGAAKKAALPSGVKARKTAAPLRKVTAKKGVSAGEVAAAKAVPAMPATEHLTSTLGHTASIPPPEASEAIAPAIPAEETSSVPLAAPEVSTAAKPKRARREAAGDAAAAPDVPEAPAQQASRAEPQELVLSGGSAFLRAIGFVQRSGGEPLTGFGNVAVSKMSTLPLPTEPGSYEFRFQVRNGTGSFKLAQRNERGVTKNAREFEMDPSGTTQVYRFSIP